MTHGGRETALVGLLDAVFDSRLEDWLCATTPTSDAAYDGDLRVLATLILLHWDEAAALATSLPEADDDGARWMHRAARMSAARELRPFGQRLRPLSGSGWDGLTAREAEVARAVAAGASNREVAASLNLAEHTVRSHLSRVLSAFGLASRSGLPGVVRTAPSHDERPWLTARGHQNAAIAAELGTTHGGTTRQRHLGSVGPGQSDRHRARHGRPRVTGHA